MSNPVHQYKDNIIKDYISFLSDRTLFEIIIIYIWYIYEIYLYKYTVSEYGNR